MQGVKLVLGPGAADRAVRVQLVVVPDQPCQKDAPSSPSMKHLAFLLHRSHAAAHAAQRLYTQLRGALVPPAAEQSVDALEQRAAPVLHQLSAGYTDRLHAADQALHAWLLALHQLLHQAASADAWERLRQHPHAGPLLGAGQRAVQAVHDTLVPSPYYAVRHWQDMADRQRRLPPATKSYSSGKQGEEQHDIPFRERKDILGRRRRECGKCGTRNQAKPHQLQASSLQLFYSTSWVTWVICAAGRL